MIYANIEEARIKLFISYKQLDQREIVRRYKNDLGYEAVFIRKLESMRRDLVYHNMLARGEVTGSTCTYDLPINCHFEGLIKGVPDENIGAYSVFDDYVVDEYYHHGWNSHTM